MENVEDIKSHSLALSRSIIQVLLKAKKNLRLYPSNNPMYKRTVDDVVNAYADFFRYRDSLDLKIGRNEISFDGEPIFQGEGKDDNLALIFFRDGLRELVFKREITDSEIQEFLEIMSVDFDSEDVEDDIVTLLWEKDFANISYEVDEAVLIEDENYQEEATRQAKDGAMEEDSVKLAHEEALKIEKSESVAIVQISEDDLKSLLREIERDSDDKKPKVIEVVFDMLSLAESGADYKDLARILNSIVEFSVRNGDLDSAVKTFQKTKEFIDRAQSEEVKRALSIVLSYAGTSNIIRFIGERLDAEAKVDEDSLNRYVGYLGANAIPSFIELLGELKTINARRHAINALAVLGKKDLNSLVKGLRDSRWYVVRNIVYILRIMGDKRAVEHVARMANHEDVRVRKEALRTLGELGGAGAAQIIRDYLNDDDESVRITAVKALGASDSEYAKRTILDYISDRNFLSLKFEEMKSCFEVLSRWKDEAVYDFVMELLNKNPLLKRNKYNEVKASAVYCLGLMGNKESLDTLERLRESKSKVISEHAYAAIKRITYGR